MKENKPLCRSCEKFLGVDVPDNPGNDWVMVVCGSCGEAQDVSLIRLTELKGENGF